MRLLWSTQSPLSGVRVYTYSHRDLVQGFSRNCPDPVTAHCQVPESTHILAAICVTTYSRLSESGHVVHRLLF
jgi:hypothetical protein